MNREDIIRMAQEAQMPFYWRTGEITYLDKLERFATLVATNDTSQKRVDKTSVNVHEPVAWVSSEELLVMRGNALGGAKDWRINVGLVKQDGDVGLYTTPPQRKPLTDEQIQYAFRTNSVTVDDGNAYMVAGKRAINIARAIEAAVWEKQK